MSLLALVMLVFVGGECMAAKRVGADDRQHRGEKHWRDSEFVDQVMRQLDLVENGVTVVPFKMDASPQIVWCADRQLCQYGYHLVWDDKSGFQVRPYERFGSELRDECARKQKWFDELNLDFKCE